MTLCYWWKITEITSPLPTCSYSCNSNIWHIRGGTAQSTRALLFIHLIMDGLDEFSRRPEELDADIARLDAVLDRVYTALGNKEMPL